MEFGDLTTLADVKAWLQTGHSAFPVTDDGLLTRLITAASQYIQSWLSRPVTLADYVEVRDGTGGEALQFACFPVVDVQLLTIEGQAIPPASSTRASGYVFSQTRCLFEASGLAAGSKTSQFPVPLGIRRYHPILPKLASSSSHCVIASVHGSARSRNPWVAPRQSLTPRRT